MARARQSLHSHPDLPVLIYLALPTDEVFLSETLGQEHLKHKLFTSIEDLCLQINGKCGAAIFSEELFVEGIPSPLGEALEKQPSWSDLPLIVLTSGSDETSRTIRRELRLIDQIRHVTFLERPVRRLTLLSAIFVALRARERQFETCHHLAELQRLKDELIRQSNRLIDADRRKDDFLAVLSHEIRGPLSAMGSAVKLLQFDRTPERDQWIADVLSRQVKNLTHLTNDLLDVTRISRGKIKLRSDLISLPEIMFKVASSMRPVVGERNQCLDLDIPHDKIHVCGDAVRIEQIISNLITNASKYSAAGKSIVLGLRRESGMAKISVLDQGVGLSLDAIEHVFDPFMQVDTTLDRSAGGLGIGLSLVKVLTELHGGTVSVSSPGPGKGSTFSVSIPESPPNARVLENCMEEDSKPASSKRVLIVDDNRDAAIGLAAVLENSGHRVILAHDGFEAMEKVTELRPDALVLDIGLPGMDGYEVAETIRSNKGQFQPLIVAVTGYGQERDRRLSKLAGFDYHLTKPVDDRQLLSILKDAASI
jgi:signal transduction histidine kinase/CheY-like chemotaxis protein